MRFYFLQPLIACVNCERITHKIGTSTRETKTYFRPRCKKIYFRSLYMFIYVFLLLRHSLLLLFCLGNTLERLGGKTRDFFFSRLVIFLLSGTRAADFSSNTLAFSFRNWAVKRLSENSIECSQHLICWPADEITWCNVDLHIAPEPLGLGSTSSEPGYNVGQQHMENSCIKWLLHALSIERGAFERSVWDLGAPQWDWLLHHICLSLRARAGSAMKSIP